MEYEEEQRFVKLVRQLLYALKDGVNGRDKEEPLNDAQAFEIVKMRLKRYGLID